MIPLNNIIEAKKRLEGVIQKTPFGLAPILSKEYNANIYLKKENLQFTGSFKLRGAFNKIATLTKEQHKAGIVAASAGNHAQGVAFSANHFNIEATIVMPEITPLTKIRGVKYYGANVILHGTNFDEAYKYAQEYTLKHKKTFIHPYADDDVIAGQGTLALEILEEIDHIDTIIIPIGGGGLITGMASAIRQIRPEIEIIGVVATGANAMKSSFDNASLQHVDNIQTIADGIAVKEVTPKMLDHILKLVDKIVEVEDQEIANAILFLLERQKLIVEAACASALAAVMHHKVNIKNKNVVIPLSGGNIDVTMLSVIIEKGLLKSSRKMNLLVTLIDKPGALMKLTEIFNNLGANIVQIDYDRTSVLIDFGEANVTIALETKGEDHQKIIRKALVKNDYRYKQII